MLIKEGEYRILLTRKGEWGTNTFTAWVSSIAKVLAVPSFETARVNEHFLILFEIIKKEYYSYNCRNIEAYLLELIKSSRVSSLKTLNKIIKLELLLIIHLKELDIWTKNWRGLGWKCWIDHREGDHVANIRAPKKPKPVKGREPTND